MTDWGWFRQEWVDIEHPYVDSTDHTVNGALAHLRTHIDAFETIAPRNAFRIRHVNSNQCIYSHPGNGSTSNHWQCWNDPAMEFTLDPVGTNRFRIRDVNQEQCLYAQPTNGGSVNHWQCWDDPNMVWSMERLSDTTFRLRHERTGRCLYPHPGNGSTMNVWSCWDDPNMIFTLDAAGANWARESVAAAETTFNGYSVLRTTDGDRSTAVGGRASWANAWNTPDLPQLVTYDLGASRVVTRLDLFTTASHPLRDFDLLWFDGTNWQPIQGVTFNAASGRGFVFPPVRTNRIAVRVRRGPDAQFNFARLNEVEIY